MKHATTPQARRSKRLQTDLSEGGPSSVVETPPMPRQQTGHGGAQEVQRGQEAMQLNVQALTSTISAAVAQAIKAAMAVHQASVPSTAMPTPSAAVDQVVQKSSPIHQVQLTKHP